MWGLGPDQVYASGWELYRFDGVRWETVDTGELYSFSRVYGFAEDDLYAAAWHPDARATVAHFDGISWTPQDSQPFRASPTFMGQSADDLWMVDIQANVKQYQADTWPLVDATLFDGEVTDIWVAAQGTAFAVTDLGNLLRYSAGEWQTLACKTVNPLNAVWGSSINDVYAVGWAGTILHWNGNTVTTVAVGSNDELAAIWGPGPDNIYIVGQNGTRIRKNGTTWTVAQIEQHNFTAIYGFGPNDIYATAYHWDGILIQHFNGTDWISTQTGIEGYPTALWGPARDQLYLAGHNELILYCNATASEIGKEFDKSER